MQVQQYASTGIVRLLIAQLLTLPLVPWAQGLEGRKLKAAGAPDAASGTCRKTSHKVVSSEAECPPLCQESVEKKAIAGELWEAAPEPTYTTGEGRSGRARRRCCTAPKQGIL